MKPGQFVANTVARAASSVRGLTPHIPPDFGGRKQEAQHGGPFS